jgi:hypothetical protein
MKGIHPVKRAIEKLRFIVCRNQKLFKLFVQLMSVFFVLRFGYWRYIDASDGLRYSQFIYGACLALPFAVLFSLGSFDFFLRCKMFSIFSWILGSSLILIFPYFFPLNWVMVLAQFFLIVFGDVENERSVEN